MPPIKNIIGKRYGRLVVIERFKDSISKGGNKSVVYKCKCDCGNIVYVRGAGLRKGNTKSCGCYHKETSSKLNYKHGKSKTRIYKIWQHMKERCYIESNKSYINYGGRGITICDEWLGEQGFENFYNWAITHGYTENLTIDREDNNKIYCPENCRWATAKIQANNRRSNRIIECDGIVMNESEWSKSLGIPRHILSNRLKRGWSDEKTIKYPIRLCVDGKHIFKDVYLEFLNNN